MIKRILVVEDQEDNRQIIRDLLSATDYKVTEAESGEAKRSLGRSQSAQQRQCRCRWSASS